MGRWGLSQGYKPGETTTQLHTLDANRPFVHLFGLVRKPLKGEYTLHTQQGGRSQTPDPRGVRQMCSNHKNSKFPSFYYSKHCKIYSESITYYYYLSLLQNIKQLYLKKK